MDANEISCPKCGHPNNYISEGCVKCGIIFSKYLALQQKRIENKLSHADDTVKGSTLEEKPATISADKPASAALESISADNKIQAKAETPPSAPEVQSTKETKPEKSQAQSVEDTSMAEIELPREASAQPSENQIQISSETPSAGKEELEISISPEEKPEPAATAEVTSAESEALATEPLAVQEKGERVIQEPLGKPGPESVAAETTPAAEEILELVEPVEIKKQTKPQTEAHAENIKLQKKPDTAIPKDAGIAKAEQEVPLEEVAQQVQVQASSMKSEEQTREALLKQQKAALETAEKIKKEKETQARVAALKEQKLAQSKREALDKQKAAQLKVEALKKQKDELVKQEALKKQKASQAQAEVLQQQKEAQAVAETSAQEPQAMAKESSEFRQSLMSKDIDSKLKIMALLKKYEGMTIGINYDNSADIKEAQLVEANDEYFSVSVKDKKLQYSYPLQTLLSLIEGEDGVEAGEAESKNKFSAVIKVYPLVLF